MGTTEFRHVSRNPRGGEVRVTTYCQAKSMSVLGTKNELGSEAIRDRNLVHREHAMREGDKGTLEPLVS